MELVLHTLRFGKSTEVAPAIVKPCLFLLADSRPSHEDFCLVMPLCFVVCIIEILEVFPCIRYYVDATGQMFPNIPNFCPLFFVHVATFVSLDYFDSLILNC